MTFLILYVAFAILLLFAVVILSRVMSKDAMKNIYGLAALILLTPTVPVYFLTMKSIKSEPPAQEEVQQEKDTEATPKPSDKETYTEEEVL